jgi:hypothetical protein
MIKKLSTYVSAIHRRPAPVAILRAAEEKSCYQDQGFEVRQSVTIFHFDNDVVLRRTIEQDEFPSEAACAECWITYEVVSDGEVGAAISPQSQVFENACRESFWLKYHTA